MKTGHRVAGATLAGDGLAGDALLRAHNSEGGALSIHVLVVVWSRWRGDVVETRRRLRGPILAAGALYAIVVIAVQNSQILWRSASAERSLAAVALVLLSLAGIGALLRADADLFAPAGTALRAAVESRSPAPARFAEDTKSAGKLDRLMREIRANREEGVSILALASKLGMLEFAMALGAIMVRIPDPPH